jgi:hypothetical protein
MILFHVFIKFCCICDMLITVLVMLAKHNFIINTIILKTMVNSKHSLKSFVRGSHSCWVDFSFSNCKYNSYKISDVQGCTLLCEPLDT